MEKSHGSAVARNVVSSLVSSAQQRGVRRERGKRRVSAVSMLSAPSVASAAIAASVASTAIAASAASAESMASVARRTMLCDAPGEHALKLRVDRQAEAARPAADFAGDAETSEAQQTPLRVQLGQQHEEATPTAELTADCVSGTGAGIG